MEKIIKNQNSSVEQKHIKKTGNDHKAIEKKLINNEIKVSEKKKGLSSTNKEKASVSDTPKTSEQKEINPLNNFKFNKSEIEKLGIFDQFNTKLEFIKRLNARPGLALDIDNDKISYIKFKKAGRKIQIEKCGIQAFDQGYRLKAMQLTLTNLRSRIYKHGMKVYVSFYSPDINIRQIIVPKTKKKSDLESAILFKNQNELANFDNKTVWNYHIIEEFSEEGTKKLRILVTTIPYEVVRAHMEILISVGMRPEKLIPRPLAATTAYNAMVTEPDNDLLVVISSFFTQIFYFRNGKLHFFRNAAMGVSNVKKAMEEKNNGSLSINDELKKLSTKKEQSHGKDLSTAIKERLFKKLKESKEDENSVIKMLYSEIKRSTDYINTVFPVEKIKRTFVTGSGIQEKEIVKYFKDQFKDSVIFLKPQFSLTEVNTSKYGEYFTALGTSLQVGNEFDTIPAQYRSLQVFKNVNILLITLLFLSIAGAFSFSYFQKYDYVKNQNTLAQLGQQYQTLNPIQSKYDDLVFKYGSIQKDINGLLGFVKKTPELLDVLRLFTNETPPFIILNEMNFEEYIPPKAIKKNKAQVQSNYKYRITLSGQINSDFQMGDVVLINFMNQLNDLNYFKEIKLTNKRKEIDRGLFEFWLELLL